MERVILYIAFFLICFNIGGLATTNILRLTSGNNLSVLSSKCYCDNCGKSISPFFQLPIVSYIICKGKCKICKAKIPGFPLFLEIIILIGMFLLFFCFDFSVFGVTIGFLYYEVLRIIVIVKKGKRNTGFALQYIISVLSMIPYYAMTVFVSVLYAVVCKS